MHASDIRRNYWKQHRRKRLQYALKLFEKCWKLLSTFIGYACAMGARGK